MDRWNEEMDRLGRYERSGRWIARISWTLVLVFLSILFVWWTGAHWFGVWIFALACQWTGWAYRTTTIAIERNVAVQTGLTSSRPVLRRSEDRSSAEASGWKS